MEYPIRMTAYKSTNVGDLVTGDEIIWSDLERRNFINRYAKSKIRYSPLTEDQIAKMNKSPKSSFGSHSEKVEYAKGVLDQFVSMNLMPEYEPFRITQLITKLPPGEDKKKANEVAVLIETILAENDLAISKGFSLVLNGNGRKMLTYGYFHMWEENQSKSIIIPPSVSYDMRGNSGTIVSQSSVNSSDISSAAATPKQNAATIKKIIKWGAIIVGAIAATIAIYQFLIKP